MTSRKEIIEKAALVVGGALVGGAATYFATREILKKKYVELADREIGSMKEVFDKHIAKIEGEKQELEEDLTDPEKHPVYAATTIESEQEHQDILKQRKQDKREYDRIVKGGGYSGKKVLDDEWKGKEPERDTFYPYIITFDEFYEDNPDYSKTSITFYKEDNTLLDDAEEIIPNHIDIVGPEALEFFGWKSKDPFVVHVRNEKIETDFEITLDEGSYADTILGDMEAEYNRKKHKKRLDE